RGISEAGSDLIAFLDSDDEWMPTFLETVIRLYNRYPQAGAFATAYKLKMPDGHFERAKIKFLPKPPWEGILPNYFRAAFGGNNPVILPSAVLIKKVVFEKVGGFSVNEKSVEDLDMWARIALKYSIAWSSRVEMVYRRDVINSKLKTHKLTKDIGVIDSLKDGLSQSSNDIKKDILNLIGKYYRFCSWDYRKSGDRENAIRCIKESIRYTRGYSVMKPIIWRIILSLPRQVWDIAQYAHSLFNKYYYRTK
ncbi:MAG: glycosyltransferase, partial [Bacteroidetes bacterium]